MKHEYVFVYGTLKTDGPNHYLLNGSDRIGIGETAERFEFLSNGFFPMILKPENDASGVHVSGEVYRVSPENLRRLDRLEANGRMYQREEIEINLAGLKNTFTAWSYLWIMSTDGLKQIVSFP